MQYFLLFLEGIITFISPCLLPMLPVYVSYFAGGAGRTTAKTLRNALAFVGGFTVVFILMGALAGTVGGLLREHGTIVNLLTGSIVVLLGLHFFGLFRLPFFGGPKTGVTRGETGVISAFLFGTVFSIGWTPCVGAFLGSALMIASREGSTLTGILLLLVYSLGLGIPFVLSALLIDRLKGTFAVIKRHYTAINRISGAILVITGIAMMTGLFQKLLSLIS